jgi:hypothetical protein
MQIRMFFPDVGEDRSITKDHYKAMDRYCRTIERNIQKEILDKVNDTMESLILFGIGFIGE